MSDISTLAQVRNLISSATGLFTYSEFPSDSVTLDPLTGRTIAVNSQSVSFQVEFYTQSDAVVFAEALARQVRLATPYSEIIVQPMSSGNCQVVFDP